ncbi:D-3-phosphoglycerate dehydrogenase 1 [Aspergillus lentulus]|uniref:2-oxoglutarate reductase n=1 Tax=Aspergillus lentulus TaxID=293939 RepID=A0AAN4PM88_ASPLE|nr:D-3-phosphoglycerate dehydrogenase 1 [Aspergillus lentulus]
MATSARDINIRRDLNVSQNANLSTSPTASFQSAPSSHGGSAFAGRTIPLPNAKHLKPFATEDIKVLLLENVNQTGRDILTGQGYQVEFLKSSLPEDQLIEKIRDVHVIGIRSKTKLTSRVLKEARNLIVIGCFCIGTNQVDLQYAAEHGIAVFNSPFSNSRSVAELVIAEIIALARQLGDRSMEMHGGTWNKVSAKCWEIRGKTLGIIGYGHIGAQLSVLAEAMGLSVIFYDVLNLMALGTAQQVPTLEALLSKSDFVTCHVPELPETKDMISSQQFEQMKPGAYLINASRGSVVDIPALIHAMRSGKIAGAALDVYPNEPAGNGDYFNDDLNTWASDLRGLKNVILTPHIGGSTEEAQSAIGVEVGQALVRYVNEGTTLGAVNLPEVTLRSLTMEEPNHARVIYIHHNVPGVLRKVNEILGDHNVDKQMTDSRGDVAYLMADISNVDNATIKELYERLESLSCVFVRSGPPQISSEEGTYNSFHEATNALLTGTGKAQNMELRPTTSNAAAWVLSVIGYNWQSLSASVSHKDELITVDIMLDPLFEPLESQDSGFVFLKHNGPKYDPVYAPH